MPSDLPHPGELLAGYRIERLLGHGATGVVFLARQVALDRPVALKVVGAPFATDQAFRARFRHEARAAAALDHPNVVTVLDSGEDADRLWLAMRLVDGPDLRVLLRRTGRLEPAHAVSIVEQVAAALDAAHAAGLVHRDVKPGNVLVEDAPGGALHAELADFGLAGGPVEGAAGGDSTGEGTPGYAAPEQLAGHEVTAAADVYGLGRVLAEMLTGDPAAPTGPGASGFAGVVARATDPDPAWRYPTAGALAVAARAVLDPQRAGGDAAGPAATAAGAGVVGATSGGPGSAVADDVAPRSNGDAGHGAPDGEAPAARPADDAGREAPAADPLVAAVVGASGVAGSLPSPDEVHADEEYEPVAPLTPSPTVGHAGSGRRRAPTLVAAPRRRRRRWLRALPLVVLLGIAAAAALVSGELRDGMLESGPASDRHRSAVPATPGSTAGRSGSSSSPGTGSSSGSAASGSSAGGSAAAGGGRGSGTERAGGSADGGRGSAGGAGGAGRAGGAAGRDTSAGPTTGDVGPGTDRGDAGGDGAIDGAADGSARGPGATADGTGSGTSAGSGSRGSAADGGGDAGRGTSSSATGGSRAPSLGASGPGTAPAAIATPPAPGMRRFGGGGWALDLPAADGWRQTAVQELSGGRTLLTRLRRGDGARLVVEHRPGQAAVFGPWPGSAFAVRLPDAGRLDARLFRGGRYAMCRAAVCAAVPVNGPTGGVLLVVSGARGDADAADLEARRELRRAARGLRVG